MGHGESRELGSSKKVERVLNPELSTRLGAALTKLDGIDNAFKTLRDDERNAQLAKIWKAKCKEMDAQLRVIGQVIIEAHQVGFDVGSDGGGRDQKPFIYEVNDRFPRLEFRLQGNNVVGVCNNRGIAQQAVVEVDYEWLETTVVTWLVWLIEQGGE